VPLIDRSIRLGIPLVFKQEGSTAEAAGQTHEHELARNREPLLFSFSDPEASHACIMKVGSGLHKSDDGRPVWSLRFSLGMNMFDVISRRTTYEHDCSRTWLELSTIVCSFASRFA
jgi:hypothetical protein